jgi:hypothetical protein
VTPSAGRAGSGSLSAARVALAAPARHMDGALARDLHCSARMSPDTLNLISAVASIVSAIGTLAAVSAAFWFYFHDKRRSQAKLEVYIVNDPPTWPSFIVESKRRPDTGLVQFRLMVGNAGPAVARGIEAIVHDFEIEADAGWQRLHSFLPQPLRWANAPGATLSALVVHSRRVIEVAQIGPRGDHAAGFFAISFAVASPAAPCEFEIDWAKSYQFKVTVTAENAPNTVELTLQFGLPGQRSDLPMTASSLEKVRPERKRFPRWGPWTER